MSSDDIDPTTLGDIIEGDLYKTANDVWVIRDKKGEHRIDDILKEYKGEEVRMTIASFSDLVDLQEYMKSQEKNQE